MAVSFGLKLLRKCRQAPVKSLVGAGCLLIIFYTLGGYVLQVTKVIDPNDPRFNPLKFQFEDYVGSEEKEKLIGATLLKMFPKGTDQRSIDNILVNMAGAKKSDLSVYPKLKGVIRYKAELPSRSGPFDLIVQYGIRSWTILIRYNSEQKSETLQIGGLVLYGEKIDT